MSDAAYHADPAIGSTALRALIRSAEHYHAEYVAMTAPRAETPAMARGTAVHCAVLEPEKWATKYAVAPECDRRTKVGKETWAAFQLANLDKRRITAEEHETAEAIAAAVRKHPAAAHLLAHGVGTEVQIAWTDEASGVACKGKVDLVCDVGGDTVLVDLKTTKDASPHGFPREVANWMLHVQAAHYLDGWRTVHGVQPAAYALIAVEAEAPHVVAAYVLDAAAIHRGSEMRAEALSKLVECRKTGIWPGYSVDIQTVELPSWAA